MLSSIPLLVVPFILYNLGLAGVFGAGPGATPGASSCSRSR